MESSSNLDGDMLIVAQSLVAFADDSSNWGESGWSGSKDELLIWEWAESKNRLDIMSKIARDVADFVIQRARFDVRNEKCQQLASKFEYLTSKVDRSTQAEIYVGFLEGLLPFTPLSSRLSKLDEILSLYQYIGWKEKIVYYLFLKATELNGLYVIGKLNSGEDEIWRLLIEAYRISKEIDFDKGITLALLGLGKFLGRKNKNGLAMKFLYQAHLYSKKAHTKFGITAIEEFRKIRDRSNMPTETYQAEIDLDLLVDEFLREVKI